MIPPRRYGTVTRQLGPPKGRPFTPEGLFTRVTSGSVGFGPSLAGVSPGPRMTEPKLGTALQPAQSSTAMIEVVSANEKSHSSVMAVNASVLTPLESLALAISQLEKSSSPTRSNASRDQ